MRPKHQVTLPASIVRQVKIKADNTMTVAYINGSIVLTPTVASDENIDVMSFAGMGRGLWGESPEAIEANLREMKEAWER
jgi:hypothetical protein